MNNTETNIWNTLVVGSSRSQKLRNNPDHKEGLLSIIDQLRGEKINYMHAWSISSGIIKKVKGNKIFILDGYKLRRLDITLTHIDHPAINAYVDIFYNSRDITFSSITDNNPF